jgi:ribosome maturation factor RimP
LAKYNSGGSSLSNNVIEKVTELVQPITDRHNFELVEVEFVKEGQGWFLRVYIDKVGGINIEECAMVSDELSEILGRTRSRSNSTSLFLRSVFSRG